MFNGLHLYKCLEMMDSTGVATKEEENLRT